MSAGGMECRVEPLTTEQYPTKAKRPAYSVLDKTKIKKSFSLEIPEWQEALTRCMYNLIPENRR